MGVVIATEEQEARPRRPCAPGAAQGIALAALLSIPLWILVAWFLARAL